MPRNNRALPSSYMHCYLKGLYKKDAKFSLQMPHIWVHCVALCVKKKNVLLTLF